MPMRLKLILPTLMLGLAGVLGSAAASAGAGAGTLAGLGVLAVALVVLQLAVHERCVMGALRGLLALLDERKGAQAPAVRDREWRELQGRLAALCGEAMRHRAALEQAREHMQRSRDALQSSEERYALAVRGAQDGVWEHDLFGRTVWVSPRLKHMLGLEFDGDRIGADDWHARLHPDDRDGAVRALEALARGDCARCEHQHRMRHCDGRWRWLLSRAAAIRHANGSAWRIVGLDTDITRLKRIEEVVDAIAQGTAGTSGEEFFRALVRQFARALCVDCAFVAQCADHPVTRARTLAYWRRGAFAPNREYELAGTPCEHVLREGRIHFQPAGLAREYPRECGRDSYLGLPILGRDGAVIGHLAFVDDKPMDEDMLIESVFRIFAARAAVELELQEALARLAALERPAVASKTAAAMQGSGRHGD